ncbi:MAG: LacI family transcriptional regulator [Opitutaceae bacterium]|jgi:DNA-binding LacI/PurR family transcriptional regulator|nr:LacI family transcriptional regulator [Opitutaceae bacterium]
MGKTISLEKIARMAGVSTATVSRALNGLSGVSEAKRKTIEAIVCKSGETPRRRARSAAAQGVLPRANGTICLLQTGDNFLSTAELYEQQLRAVVRTAARHGFDVVVAFGNEPALLPPCIKKGRVAGVLVYGEKISEAVAEMLKGVPTVWIASHPKLPLNMVMPGNEDAGQLAARYLIERGHEYLGAFYPYEHHVMDVRLHAFTAYATILGKKTVRYTGRLVPKDSLKPHQWCEAILKPLVDQWLASSPRPTGLFCPDDAITAYLYPILNKCGVKIGKDVTIVSFGNEFTYLAGLDPRPASIDIGTDMMGAQAFEMLCRVINNPEAEGRGVRLNIQPVLAEP